MTKVKDTCCLCGKDFKDKYDRNNAEPLKSGDCCGTCNDDKVIPARLENLLSLRKYIRDR